MTYFNDLQDIDLKYYLTIYQAMLTVSLTILLTKGNE
jgi:hypothetical protein